LVVWTDYAGDLIAGDEGDILGARVSASGGVLDEEPIVIASEPAVELAPAVASDGVDFLVVWEDRSTDFSDVRAARVSADGVVRDPRGINVSTSVDDQREPAVTWNGTTYLIVWEDFRSSLDWNIYGARVTRSGFVADGSGLAISTSNGDQRAPAVDSDGIRSLVAWQDQGPSGSDIRGVRVAASGVVLDAPEVGSSATPEAQIRPDLAWNGSDFVVAWEEHRSSPDIYATRVTPTGSVLDSPAIAVAASPDTEAAPVAARGPVGRIGIAYERVAPELPYGGARRVFLRFFDDPANDALGAARAISGTTGRIDGVNVGTTKEPGEPAHGGDPGGRSVWYRWQAPVGGAIAFDTIGSGFDTVLGVYTGSSAEALIQIAGDDNSGGDLASKATFSAVAGTDYSIAVDGANGATGVLILRWSSNVIPNTTITSGPEGYAAEDSASFEFSSTLPEATFECSRDGGEFKVCVSPKEYTNLEDASHSFMVRSRAADTDPTPATRAWIVDTSPPSLEFLDPRPGLYVDGERTIPGGAVVVAYGPVVVEARAQDPESGVVTFRFEVDGHPVPVSEVTHDRPTETYRFTYRPRLLSGVEAVTARAINGAGSERVVELQLLGFALA
jgi:hypothetical protein